MEDNVIAFREALPMQDDELSRKLMDKISVQATQLTNLAKAFNGSSEYIEICENRIRELEEEAALRSLIDEGAAEQNLSEAALRRNDDRESSRRSEEVEQLLLVNSNHISDLEREIRSKERQCKLNEKKVLDLGLEIQKMKVQIEQYQHASRLMSKPTECSANRKVVAGLKSEIDALKAYLNSYQTRLEASKKAERAMALKVGILEDERESQPQGAYADSQAKVLILTEKVRKLKSELQKKIDAELKAKVNAMPTISAPSVVSKSVPVPVRNDIEVEDNPKSGVSSVTSSCSRGEKVAALERVIVSLQLKLDEAERERTRDKQKEAGEEREEREAREEREERGERASRESRNRVLGPEGPTNSPFMKDLKEKLKTIEQERDVLLEFIQGDMKRSAEITIMLKKEKDRVSHLQDDLNASLSKEKLLRVELESLILEIAGDNNDSNDNYNDGKNNNDRHDDNDKNNKDNNNGKIDASDGVKEGVKEDFIVSVLSSELRAAHAKVLDLEEKLEKLSQLSKLNELKELKELRELRDSGTIEASEGGDFTNSRVKEVDADLSMSRLNNSTVASRSFTSKPPWRKTLSSDIDSRRAVDDWQLERLTLIKELESIRPVDRALAELGTDLKKLRARDIEVGVYEDEILSSPIRVPLKLTTVRSYSNMYSQSNQAKGQGQGATRSVSPAVSSSRSRAQTPINTHTNMTNPNSRNRSIDNRIDNRTDHNTYDKADNTADSRNSVGDMNSDEIRRSDYRPHGALSKQHSWITLPSIPRLSSLLHERINRLFNDLHQCESKCGEMEESNQRIRSELSRAALENEREIQRLTATTTAAQDALKTCKKQLQQSDTHLTAERERRDGEQRAERVAVRVVEQTADALCGVPGGWEQFFDSKTLDLSHSVKNNRRDRGEGREGGEGMDRGDDDKGRGERGDGSLLRPPPSMVPVIVKRAVSMILSSSSDLRSIQQELAPTDDKLSSSQSILREVREENKKLSNYTDILQQKDASRERSFVRIESAVRRDLEKERALCKEQQLLVINLKMKLDTLRRSAIPPSVIPPSSPDVITGEDRKSLHHTPHVQQTPNTQHTSHGQQTPHTPNISDTLDMHTPSTGGSERSLSPRHTDSRDSTDSCMTPPTEASDSEGDEGDEEGGGEGDDGEGGDDEGDSEGQYEDTGGNRGEDGCHIRDVIRKEYKSGHVEGGIKQDGRGGVGPISGYGYAPHVSPSMLPPPPLTTPWDLLRDPTYSNTAARPSQSAPTRKHTGSARTNTGSAGTHTGSVRTDAGSRTATGSARTHTGSVQSDPGSAPTHNGSVRTDTGSVHGPARSMTPLYTPLYISNLPPSSSLHSTLPLSSLNHSTTPFSSVYRSTLPSDDSSLSRYRRNQNQFQNQNLNFESPTEMPEETPIESPSELLDLRLRKAKQTFAALRENIGSGF